MKKKTLLWIVGIIAVLAVIGNISDSEDYDKSADAASPSSHTQDSQGGNTEPSGAVSEADIISVLLHQPYLDAADISVNYSFEREKLPDRILDALQTKPHMVKKEDGGLLGTDYYALTNKTAYYYYGEIKDNRPDGFGVLADQAVSLDDLYSVNNLIYAGNFKKGAYDGYGAEFNSDEISTTYASHLINSGWLEQKYEKIAAAYLTAHVVYDGGWKNGKADKKGNSFQFGSLLLTNPIIQDGYWGGTCYPVVTVTEVKNGLANGKTKSYMCGVLIYDGETKDGFENGEGSSYFVNGQVHYDGQWKNGKYNGQGKLYDEDGTLIYSGKWKNGDYSS